MRLPLRLGQIAPEGVTVRRSGFRWMCADGQLCQAGQIIAFCNIGLRQAHGPGRPLDHFADERRDFQVAIVSRVTGRLRVKSGGSHGGQLDRLEYFLAWNPDFVLAEIEPEGPLPPGLHPGEGPSSGPWHRTLFGAGRRFTEHAEVRVGMLTGWHDRARAWWGDGTRVDGTLLSMGSCEQSALVIGDSPAFLDLMGQVPGAAQVISIPDDLLVPCARVCLEQMQRGPAELAAIEADLFASLPRGHGSRPAADWYFAATLLAGLQRSPITEGTDVLVRGGVQRVAQPDAIMMSLVAEPSRVLRHRRLGYTLSMHSYRLGDCSEPMRQWLRASFEPVDRDTSDILRDWRELIGTTRQRAPTLFLALNLSSSSASEDFLNYAQFDQPMARTVGSVRSKELNLMLHDLAREPGLAVVDTDAIVAGLGAALHQPDGLHMNGTMQQEVQREILYQLRANGVPGFS